LRKSFLKELLYRRRAEMGGKPQWPIGLIGLSPGETNGRFRLDTTAVWLSPTDPHTNPLRHRLLAEELMQRLDEARLIPAS
jgi:hypothetical protein